MMEVLASSCGIATPNDLRLKEVFKKAGKQACVEEFCVVDAVSPAFSTSSLFARAS